MLFSEPKIPQFATFDWLLLALSVPFSALQRAENSSIRLTLGLSDPGLDFQCSSASRKFLNAAVVRFHRSCAQPFSALQRAENSSILSVHFPTKYAPSFQCSSASRKFLNRRPASGALRGSALSVLFSEPKIPQSRLNLTPYYEDGKLSVLFSEPKIPQSGK